tara:strand:- start:131 stop:463 length:333 start_codon:yes stop_codon:yes gene_type:complete
MLSTIKNLFKRKESKIVLGRWARNNDVTKAIYANSDHCGDMICGDPKKVKNIVNTQKPVKIKLPQSNKLHTYKNQDFCCMLLGIDGPCEDCNLFPKGTMARISPQVYMTQ